MELQELKDMWSAYDKKLDISLKLNMQLLRKINFDKAKIKLKKLMAFKILEMIVLAVIISYLLIFTVNNFTSPQFSLSSAIFGFFAIMGFINNLKQVSIIAQLNTGYDEAIAPIQKRIENLKLLIINYVKYGLLSIPFFPIWMIMSTKIIFDYDIYNNSMKYWWLSNIAISLAFIPLVMWIFKQLSKNQLSHFWVKNFLEGAGWKNAQQAQDFLYEIEKFEKDI